MSWQVYFALGSVPCVALLFILRSWRRGIYIIFIWLLLEDVIRRLLPGQPVQVQFVKEALIMETYLAFFVTWRKQGRLFWSPPFLTSLLAFSALVLADAFNPQIQGMLIPFAGIRSYLWYVPLMWVGYHGFKTRNDLTRFSRLLMWTAVPLAALGVVQYFLWEYLPAWLQPLEGAHAFHQTAFEFQGDMMSFNSRLPSSVFGSSFRFAIFALYLFFLGMGTWGWKIRGGKRGQPWWLAVCVVASMVCIIVAGTRMAMMLSLLGLVLIILEPLVTGRGSFLVKRLRVRRAVACLVLIAAFFGALQVFQNTGRFLLYTTQGDVETHWEQFTRGQLPFVLKEAAWMGFGTGTLSQGLTYFSGGKETFEFASRESEGVGVEYGLAKVTWELGGVGLVMFLVFWMHVFWSLWKCLRGIQDSSLKGLAWAQGLFLVFVFAAFLKGHYYFGDGTTLVLYWFSMGVFFSLRRMDALENRIQLQPGEPEIASLPAGKAAR